MLGVVVGAVVGVCVVVAIVVRIIGVVVVVVVVVGWWSTIATILLEKIARSRFGIFHFDIWCWRFSF